MFKKILAIKQVYLKKNLGEFFILLLAFCCLIFPKESFSLPKFQKQSEVSMPTTINADSVSGSKIKNEIIAKGSVIIRKDTSAIFADKVTYNKDKKLINATGNVKVENIEIGDMLVEEASIKDDFSSGEFIDTKLFFYDGAYLLSEKTTRNEKEVTTLTKAIYSFCPDPEITIDSYLAKENKKPNFTYIKAKKTVIYNENNNIKTYKNVFYLYDVPVFYLPYLKIPIPSKKKESGFLHPSYTKNSNLGLGIELPYYFNIDENIDLTTTPNFSIDTGQIIVTNDLRHRLKYGKYDATLKIANNKINQNQDRTVVNRTNKEMRWNLINRGQFDFNKNNSLDIDVNHISDRNFLRDYNFNYAAFTLSQIDYNYSNKRNFHSIKTIKIQELEDSERQDEEVLALPIYDSHIESSKSLIADEKYILESNFTTLIRRDGLQYRRLSMTPEVKVPFNINGSLLEFASRFQGDIYYLENNFQNFERDNNYKTTELNYKPEISLHWRLPLIKKTKESTIMVEPIASFVASSYDKGFNAIPLEDSNSSELTVSNLFINDRIAGHDRNEAGERINYGIKTSLFNDSGDYALTVGQAIRRSNEVQDVNISGFSENNRSNYVGRFSYSANKNFNIYYAFQLNQNNLRNDINQVNADLIMKKFSINTNYLLIKKSEFSAEKREQIAITSEVQLTPKWKTKINFVRDVVLGRNLTRGIALTRDGCCTILQFSVTENNQSNLIKAQRSFNLSISFKNL